MSITMTDAASAALVALARDPEALALSAEDDALLNKLVANGAADSWFRTFEPSRDCLSLKQGNAIARVILEALAASDNAELALHQSSLLPCCDAWLAAREIARQIMERHDEDLQAITRAEHARLMRGLTERIEPLLIEADSSRPQDALSSWDRAEVIFVISPTGKHALDASIASQRSWPDFAELCVNENLAHAMTCLGYTLSDYRKASGNRHASERARGARSIASPEVRRRAVPLCSWDAIQEMVDNACATHFLFVLYAIVPITQLIALDPTKPMTFSKAAIASWNPWDGTFHDAVSVPAVTVTPKMGTLMSPSGWHSPDSICGFVHSYYFADLVQPTGS